MKTNEKQLTCHYCVNLDQATADQLEKIAAYYQRKPSELIRLLLEPVLRDHWAKMQQEEHQENNQAPTLARFTK